MNLFKPVFFILQQGAAGDPCGLQDKTLVPWIFSFFFRFIIITF